MSWTTAIVGAIGATQVVQQGAIGKYNQAVANREAQVLELQSQQIEQKKEFDIAQFDKTYQKIKGETEVNLAKSGVVAGTGTAYRIAMANAREAELQRQLIAYNLSLIHI